MDRKNMAEKKLAYVHIWGKNKKIYFFFKFYYEIALNGYLEKFRTVISLHLPKEASNALQKNTIYNRNELLKHPVVPMCAQDESCLFSYFN